VFLVLTLAKLISLNFHGTKRCYEGARKREGPPYVRGSRFPKHMQLPMIDRWPQQKGANLASCARCPQGTQSWSPKKGTSRPGNTAHLKHDNFLLDTTTLLCSALPRFVSFIKPHMHRHASRFKQENLHISKYSATHVRAW
jgi:hypothetical protein